jgi:hypothetical protein
LLKEGARGQERLIHSFVHLESLRGSMRMRLEALEEGSLGASIHGGAMGAWTLYYFVVITLLGGGRTPSRQELDLRDCRFVCFSGEVAHKSTFVCKGFFFRATKVKGASLEWFGNKGRGALSLGAFLLGSFGKSREELALYTGSIILYFLLYLML